MPQLLAKTYHDKKHADAFIQGTMFANPLTHFKQLESKDIRRDADEGIMTMPLTDGFKLELTSNALEMPIIMYKDDLVEPLENSDKMVRCHQSVLYAHN